MAESKVFDYLGGFLVLDENFWKGNSQKVWFTILALVFILLCQSLRAFISNRYNNRSVQVISTTGTTGAASLEPNSQTSISGIVSDADLRNLINELDEKGEENVQWNNVVDKRNSSVTYSVKNCKPKDGPLKYLSVTVFENCSTEVLRDFYMDYEYRKQWDKMIVEDDQLQIDDISGVEMGRTIKKFPLLTPREYVLAWRMWEGKDKTFYCFIKECESALVPRQKKYVRVGVFRSGWRIKKVPGRNACEIKLVHQEDAGLNVEMAKLAFSKGIWSYVCKMDAALRKYSPVMRPQSSSVKNAVTFMRKVPPELETATETTDRSLLVGTSTGGIVRQGIEEVNQKKKLIRKPSKKTIANGLLLLGGIVCLSRGHSALGAKIAMACILKKLAKHGNPATQVTQN
ncbi:uncharacterized protein LOC113358749 [Papaver somniferum]|uniref:uncharacterized protein LOC113358749 n=1 Tax=Papaver somniferum TaxID=3469 RepID=UPI000E70367D|nr:uncharacterized protein LOC113358749 [Papaver somniferum]